MALQLSSARFLYVRCASFNRAYGQRFALRVCSARGSFILSDEATQSIIAVNRSASGSHNDPIACGQMFPPLKKMNMADNAKRSKTRPNGYSSAQATFSRLKRELDQLIAADPPSGEIPNQDFPQPMQLDKSQNANAD
jgi:hypothetical protein